MKIELPERDGFEWVELSRDEWMSASNTARLEFYDDCRYFQQRPIIKRYNELERTLKFIKEALDYDPRTGIFTWKTRPVDHFSSEQSALAKNKRYAGTIAGRITAKGYIDIQLNGKMYKAHRLAWLYTNSVWPEEIDHINGIRSDNRLANLRSCSRSENMQNMSKKPSLSGIKGVNWDKRRNCYVARVAVKGVRHERFPFATLEAAKEAVINLRAQLHGDFANNG